VHGICDAGRGDLYVINIGAFRAVGGASVCVVR
jgi:hypothetical protein